MNTRITTTPLATDCRGSSVRVIVARDKYTVANVSQGMNDREEYARLFAASPEMLQMLQTMARMDFYSIDCSDDAIEDAFLTMNELIRKARHLTSIV